MSEPKVEGWIDRAAGTAATMLLGKTSSWSNVREAIALALVRHAPKPEDQPIRRGDVVQVVSPDAHPAIFGATFVVQDNGPFGLLGLESDPPIPVEPKLVVRIGRARYYPDGAPVED